MSPTTKICIGCEIDKPVTEFYKHGRGYRSYCKPCYVDDAVARARAREYKASIEARRRANRRYHETHKEEDAERQRVYRQANRELINQKRRDAYANDPTTVLRYVHKRRARKAQAEGEFTAEEWQSLVSGCASRCLACGILEEMTVDHVIPLSKGGSNSITNIQPLCRSCNARKGTDSTDFRRDTDVCQI